VYGTYKGIFSLETEGISLGVGVDRGFLLYRRRIPGGMVEKYLPKEAREFHVHPVEPVNLPRPITKFLEIRFGSVVLPPNATQEVFLHFPVEIGVFSGDGSTTEIMDIFSLVPPKYSLYGSTGDGVICRWAWSGIFGEVPHSDPARQGVLHLRIRNTCQSWVEVSRAVFEADGMRLFFGATVQMIAEMKVLSCEVAETVFLDGPPATGMEPAIELFKAKIIPGMDLYAARKLPGVEKNGFVMEWGLV
jgi:hypothetical protein